MVHQENYHACETEETQRWSQPHTRHLTTRSAVCACSVLVVATVCALVTTAVLKPGWVENSQTTESLSSIVSRLSGSLSCMLRPFSF